MYEKIKNQILKAKKIVFFTGAGMSTESGIPDFRSASGLYSETDYKGYNPEQILSRSFFLKKTDTFYKYYYSKIVHKDARPHIGHYAIAEFEKKGYETTVITQNIDGLHTKAGSSKVLEVHGSVLKNHCMGCGREYTLDQVLYFEGDVPVCDLCNNIIRPDITLYGESLEKDVLDESVNKIGDADIIFAVGSSLTVQPAAGLLDNFRGNLFVIINMDRTYYDKKADFVINKICGSVLAELAGLTYE